MAIDLLLKHFPAAEVPGNRVRRAPSSPVGIDRPPAPLPPLPPLIAEASPEADQPERDHLVASIRCPGCHVRHEQPIRVLAQTSAKVAKQEMVTPELIVVCPTCNTLAVVSFSPAAADA